MGQSSEMEPRPDRPPPKAKRVVKTNMFFFSLRLATPETFDEIVETTVLSQLATSQVFELQKI